MTHHARAAGSFRPAAFTDIARARLNGALDRGLFVCFARHAQREAPEYSYRKHPEFAKACWIYARRQRTARALAAIDALVPEYRPAAPDRRARYEHEPYDGLGTTWAICSTGRCSVKSYPSRSGPHRELTDAEIARWDARVDAWAKAHGASLDDEPAPEIQPWGYWMDIDGARVWTDDID